MKRFISILFVVSFTSICVCAQSSQVKSIIKKYDAKYLRQDVKNGNPAMFWYIVTTNNKRVTAIDNAYKKKNKTLNDAMVTLSYLDAYNNGPDNIVYNYYPQKNQLVKDLGIEQINNQYPMKIIASDDLNANMDAKGQMCIFEGCFKLLTYEEIRAVCAHEIAHYYCSHVLSRFWAAAKKQKRNKMWADIATSFAVGAMAATSAYAGSAGVDVSHFNNIIANAGILYDYSYQYANNATIKYKYRYDREEESEADIIAYRFLEYAGYGGEAFLSMLKKLKYYCGDSPTGIYDNHPSLTFRIEVIEAMMKGYSGK